MGKNRNTKICRLLVLHAFETKIPKVLAIHILSYRVPMILQLPPIVDRIIPIAEYNHRGARRVKRDWRHPLVRSKRAYSFP